MANRSRPGSGPADLRAPSGPTIVDGMLYVHSGYGLWGGMSGNALIAFSVNGE